MKLKLATAIVLSLSLGCLLPAQTVRGVIAGAITDANQKPVAQSKISITQEETNNRRVTTADSHGEFLVSSLPPGRYRIEVERDGYRKHVQTIALAVNQEIRIDIPLLPGKQTDEVTVVGTPSLLKTDSVAIGGLLTTRQIQGLPLDGRNFYELSLLLPGVVPAAAGSAGSVRGDFAVNVNGAREDANNFLLDGIYNGDPKLNGFAVSPPVDAIREFEVLTSTYDASFGRNSGGQVNVVLRSGSNQVHGTVYEFFRNAAMDSRNFFAPAGTAPKYQRNQFGASMGAPVVKNRTFVFVDYEGRRNREGITRVTNVPTLAERQGDFSRSFGAPINLFTGQPFPNNQIPAQFIHPVGARIVALYPLPNRNVPGQNFVSSPTLRDRNDHFDIRADHVFNSKSELSFRYSLGDRLLFDPFAGAAYPQVPGYGVEIPRRGQNAVVSETHTFTPTFLNEIRGGFNRVAQRVIQQNAGVDLNAQVGLPSFATNPRDRGLSSISIIGYSPLGDETNNPQRGVTNVYEVLDQATWSRGRHLIRFGFDFRALQQNAFRDVSSRGFLNFTGQILGNALGEVLLGFPTVTGGAVLNNPQHLRSKSYNFFAQDTWRVRPDLTLTLGLRYEYNTPPVDPRDQATIYNPATGGLVPVGTGGIPRSGFEPDRNNLAPRVGLAWSPGRGKTVIRTGYGFYYDQSSLAPSEGLYFSAPYFVLNIFIPFGQTLISLSDPFPKNFPFALPTSAFTFQRDLRTPYMQHYNFTVERQIGKARMVEVGYVGSKGTRLFGARDINQPRPSNAASYQRPNPRFDDINILESRGNSNYNSLQARLVQRLDFGLSLLAAYTYAKSIDEGSGFFSSFGDPNFPQDSYNLGAERGRSNFDVRHRATISYSYDLPFKGKLLGGWQTFGILSFQTGRPFTLTLQEFDNSNTGRSNLGFGANDRPNLVRNPELSNPSPTRWFDTGAVAIPARGNFGNAGRNTIEGPGSQTINASIIKNTPLSERMTLQFRAEAFNLFNHANFGMPDNFVLSPTFGQILSADNPRRIQLGLKLLF